MITENRRDFLRMVGLPPFNHATPPPWPIAAGARQLVVERRCGADPMLALIATRSHLPYAEVASATFLDHHPEFRAFLLLVDGTEADRLVLAGVTIILLADLDLPEASRLAVKLDANELSNALKPVLLQHLTTFGDRAVYIDCDMAVFARADALLRALDDAALVLTPHMFELFPRPDQYWRQPSNADIFNSGLINAGFLGIDLNRAAPFLSFWRDANLNHAWAPGGARQTDQQFLNWALVNCEGVRILRDRTCNVAYWNLHERSFRQVGAPGQKPKFEVDGKPLTAFHFSGYDPADPLRLSRHDHRYSVYTLPSVALILEWYSARLAASRLASFSHASYRFDRLANGVALTPLLRDVLRRYEISVPRVDASTSEGADAICAFLMRPLAAKGSRLPLIAAEIYDARRDLQQIFPRAHVDLDPIGFWRWFCRHAGAEFEIEDLIARFRGVLESDSVAGFAESVIKLLPQAAALKMLGVDRRRAAKELSEGGWADVAGALLSGETEWFFFSSFSAVLALYERRPDLKQSFPDPFGASHEPFSIWLEDHGVTEQGLPADVAALFAEKSSEHVLARLFSYLSRREDVAATAIAEMLSDAPDGLVRALLRDAGEGLEYDLADVEVFCFLHRHDRKVLVPLYLELPAIRRRSPSSRTAQGRRALLPVAADLDWVAAGCRLHDASFEPADVALEVEVRQLHSNLQATGRDVMSVLKASRLEISAGRLTRIAEQQARRSLALSGQTSAEPVRRESGLPGVNLFGYFFADTGVGESSRGLAQALSLLADVRRVPQFTSHLDSRARLTDVFTRFDHHADDNVFVSYPHALEDVFGLLPPEFVSRRRNIIHLAWEQRDWNTHWRSIYGRYDEIWAISDFAAQPFREMFGAAKVRVVPNVLLVDQYPSGEAAAEARFKRPVFRFLFVFDANSSIERKNPEAVLEAFSAAFSGSPRADEVELVLKVNNLDRTEHSARVADLRRMAACSGLAVSFDGRRLPRDEVLRLIASADCYVSLHRAEGFGYTMAEAMFYGVPVIASGYSGNLEYMTPDNSYLVPCTETLVREADGPFQRGSVWAEPDVGVAADIMRWLVENREAAYAAGQLGAAAVRAKLLPDMVAEGLRPFFYGAAISPDGARQPYA